MSDVICISSDSDEVDSDVEIIGSYSHFRTKADPLPLTAVRVDVDAVNVNVPKHYIDLKDPRWSLPAIKMRKRKSSTSLAVVDFTEDNVAYGTKQETGNLQSNNCQIKGSTKKELTSNRQDCNSQRSSSSDPTVLQRDCKPIPRLRYLDSRIQNQMPTVKTHNCVPTVKLKRLPFLENHVTELKTSSRSVFLTTDCSEMSLNLSQPGTNSDGPHTEPSLDQSPPQIIESTVRQVQQNNRKEFISKELNGEISQRLQSLADTPFSDRGTTVTDTKENRKLEASRDNISDILIPSLSSSYSSQDKAHVSFQKEVLCSNLEELKSDRSDSGHLSAHSSSHPPPTEPIPSEPNDIDSLSHTSPIFQNLTSQVVPASMSERTHAENTPEWQLKEIKTDEASSSSDLMHWSTPSDPLLSLCKTEDMDGGSESMQYEGDLEIDIPVSSLWQDGFDGELEKTDSRSDVDFREASNEDRHFVCQVTLEKLIARPAQARINEEEQGFGSPELLCRQSLSLVYSTIDENYPEGTLQLLSDLLQPGYYPPKDITFHLLHRILLDAQCPYHLCVQAFNMLMRTQRHHMADKTTVPWDWELLTAFMANEDHTKRHRIDVVRMLMEYVVQTLEDDFRAKCSSSSLHLSMAKAILSCNQQFHRVRDVIKWLFSAIIKSTEQGDSREEAREKDEQIRMVSILQRMLSLALEVDRSPALTSAKLSQELFHMLIGSVPLRAHRMLLLETLQSKLLRCKLLEHLLDYACPLKVSLPMSLSLLLHFLKNCTLAPDPSDGTERWKRWEELVHLLWMLLLSYNKAMKGYLSSSVSEHRGRVGTMVYKQDDMVSKPAVCEAVEAFLSRSKADLGKALPLHVEESLTYLQDYLLDVCQC